MGAKGFKGFSSHHRGHWMLCLLSAYLLGLHTARAGSTVARVTGPEGKPLPNAVLSLHSDSATRDEPTQAAIMDQINKQYVPPVLPIQVGTWVSFPNHDDVCHHVYSFSDAKHFELRRYHGTEAAPRTVEHRTELEALFLLPELADYGP